MYLITGTNHAVSVCYDNVGQSMHC